MMRMMSWGTESALLVGREQPAAYGCSRRLPVRFPSGVLSLAELAVAHVHAAVLLHAQSSDVTAGKGQCTSPDQGVRTPHRDWRSLL